MQTLTEQEFLYRSVPVNYDGTGTIVDIKGQTLGWNQLFNEANPRKGSNVTNYTNNNGIVSFTSTNTNNNYVGTEDIIVGHKYYVKLENMSASTVNLAFQQPYANIAYVSANATYTNIFEHTTSSLYVMVFRSESNFTATVRFMLIDLTILGKDSMTLAEFETWLATYYSLPYYSHDSGSLLSFNGTGIKTVGFNQWDEEWEVGDINPQTGQNNSGLTCFRSKNYIRVIPSQIYYFYSGTNYTNPRMAYYDADKNYLGAYPAGWSGIELNQTFEMKANAYYVRFKADGTVYNNDICLNISDTSKNGTYEPYTTSTLSLPISTYFPDGMDGVGTAYDELTPTDYYKRMGMVDLGNLTWNYQSSSGNMFAGSGVPDRASNPSAICGLYNYGGVVAGVGSLETDKSFAFQSNNVGRIIIKDSAYSDPDVFKTAMSGVMLCYELATPLQNYGVVDLGLLEWTYNSGSTRFEATISDMKEAPIRTVPMLCSMYLSKYNGETYSADWDMVCFNGNNMTKVYIINKSYTNADLFTTAMSGVYLLYEKENPEQISPSLDLTYDIWDDGTEQLLPENSSVPTTTPIICDIDYRTMIPVNAEDDPDGAGVITGTGNYRYHSMATLSATPTDEIYRFLRWEDENGDTVSTNSTYTFEVGE